MANRFIHSTDLAKADPEIARDAASIDVTVVKWKLDPISDAGNPGFRIQWNAYGRDDLITLPSHVLFPRRQFRVRYRSSRRWSFLPPPVPLEVVDTVREHPRVFRNPAIGRGGGLDIFRHALLALGRHVFLRHVFPRVLADVRPAHDPPARKKRVQEKTAPMDYRIGIFRRPLPVRVRADLTGDVEYRGQQHRVPDSRAVSVPELLPVFPGHVRRGNGVEFRKNPGFRERDALGILRGEFVLSGDAVFGLVFFLGVPEPDYLRAHAGFAESVAGRHR